MVLLCKKTLTIKLFFCLFYQIKSSETLIQCNITTPFLFYWLYSLFENSTFSTSVSNWAVDIYSNSQLAPAVRVSHSQHEGFLHGSTGRAWHRNTAEADDLMSSRFASFFTPLWSTLDKSSRWLQQEWNIVVERTGQPASAGGLRPILLLSHPPNYTARFVAVNHQREEGGAKQWSDFYQEGWRIDTAPGLKPKLSTLKCQNCNLNQSPVESTSKHLW